MWARNFLWNTCKHRSCYSLKLFYYRNQNVNSLIFFFLLFICTETSKLTAGILLTALWNKIVKILKIQILIQNIYLQTHWTFWKIFFKHSVLSILWPNIIFLFSLSCWEEYWQKSSVFLWCFVDCKTQPKQVFLMWS